MATVHMINGILVLLSFIALTAGYVMQAAGKPTVSWTGPLAKIAPSLYLLQVLLGFGLLASDHSITAIHYILALAVMIPVGFGESLAKSDKSPATVARLQALGAAAATILILVAYLIAENR